MLHYFVHVRFFSTIKILYYNSPNSFLKEGGFCNRNCSFLYKWNHTAAFFFIYEIRFHSRLSICFVSRATYHFLSTCSSWRNVNVTIFVWRKKIRFVSSHLKNRHKQEYVSRPSIFILNFSPTLSDYKKCT